MKSFARLLSAAVSLSVCSIAASASTITISSSSANVYYYGFEALNSSTITVAGSGNNATVDLGTGGVWGGPIGSSNWVSFEAGTQPGGNVTAPNGTYFYYAVFNDLTPGTSIGSITVLADDTTSVYLNTMNYPGNPIVAAAPNNAAPACVQSTPNCITPASYVLPASDFVAGSNVLLFGVEQLNNGATGLDFQATVNTSATPEPSSLILLATGLLGGAGAIRRRMLA